MATRLSLEQMELMKQMVTKGVAPEDIAKHFNVAISSVHNYKRKFKQDGLSFPSVLGKRPAGDPNRPAGSVTGSRKTTKVLPNAQTGYQPTMVKSTTDVQAGGVHFVVNGVSVQVSAQARNVNIGKDSIQIDF